jgi:hypothetical protein
VSALAVILLVIAGAVLLALGFVTGILYLAYHIGKSL